MGLNPQGSSLLCHGDPGIGDEGQIRGRKFPFPKPPGLLDQLAKGGGVTKGIDAGVPDLSFDMDIDRGQARKSLRPMPVRRRLQQVKQEKDQEKNP